MERPRLWPPNGFRYYTRVYGPGPASARCVGDSLQAVFARDSFGGPEICAGSGQQWLLQVRRQGRYSTPVSRPRLAMSMTGRLLLDVSNMQGPPESAYQGSRRPTASPQDCLRSTIAPSPWPPGRLVFRYFGSRAGGLGPFHCPPLRASQLRQAWQEGSPKVQFLCAFAVPRSPFYLLVASGRFRHRFAGALTGRPRRILSLSDDFCTEVRPPCGGPQSRPEGHPGTDLSRGVRKIDPAFAGQGPSDLTTPALMAVDFALGLLARPARGGQAGCWIAFSCGICIFFSFWFGVFDAYSFFAPRLSSYPDPFRDGDALALWLTFATFRAV